MRASVNSSALFILSILLLSYLFLLITGYPSPPNLSTRWMPVKRASTPADLSSHARWCSGCFTSSSRTPSTRDWRRSWIHGRACVKVSRVCRASPPPSRSSTPARATSLHRLLPCPPRTPLKPRVWAWHHLVCACACTCFLVKLCMQVPVRMCVCVRVHAR